MRLTRICSPSWTMSFKMSQTRCSTKDCGTTRWFFSRQTTVASPRFARTRLCAATCLLAGNIRSSVGVYVDAKLLFYGSLSEKRGFCEHEQGNNYPLRGHKHDPWEGGTRATAFLSGGFLPESVRGTQSGDKLVHVSDWCVRYACCSWLWLWTRIALPDPPSLRDCGSH